MAYKPDYSKDLFKQVQDMIKKCDNLSSEIKTQRKYFEDKIEKLETENKILKIENQRLKDDNDRLKKIINNNSNNSSKLPSTDIKKNIPNNREKTSKKRGEQKGHTAHFLSKDNIKKKIENKEIEHEIINVGKLQGEFVSKYVIDIEVKTIAKEYIFFKDKNGKYNVPREFRTDVQYGSGIKTLCAVLNTEEVVAINRLTNFVSCISHGLIKISNGTIVNFIKELNTKSEELRNNIKEKLLNSSLMYTDATTARSENRNISIRNYSTEKYTLLVATQGKGKKHIEETNILNRYTGNLVHDHETVIYNYGDKHIECNVHVSRYLKGCYENTEHKWALKMRAFLCSLNEHRKKIKLKNIEKIEEEKLEKYSKRYDEILEEGYEENKKRQDEQRLLNRLKKYKKNNLLFLHDFTVPFDNNLSESLFSFLSLNSNILFNNFVENTCHE